MNFAHIICLWILMLSPQVFSRRQKSVRVTLDTKWYTTPLHLEASEFLAEESSNYFWRFVDSVVQFGPGFLQQKTPKEQYEAVLEISRKLLTPAKLKLLKFSLGLHTYSPTVEMFHQIAQAKRLPSNCECVVEIGEQFVCNQEQLKEILDSAAENSSVDVYKIDHHYPGFTSSSVTVILYGEIGSPQFNKFHHQLEEYAKQRKIDYLVRHFVWHRLRKKVRLSGYGVELAIKSTEYKAQDDTVVKVDESIEDNENEFDDEEEIEGFLFHKLSELHPEKKEKLEEFKAHLLDKTEEIANLKVWEMQELSLQAAQRIMKTSEEEGLRVMGDISQNFPTLAGSLVKVAVGSELRSEVANNQQMFMQYHNLGPTDTALFINGMYYDVETADIFTLIEVIKQETDILEGLHHIGIPEKKVSKLMKLDLAEDKQDFAVDIRDSSISYINDVEKDKHYKNWPGSVQDLLRAAYPGMLRNIRKNMYHLVLIADPSERENRDIFKLAESFYIHKGPLRIGLVFAVNANTTVDGFSDAGVAMLDAFNFVAQDKTPYEGLSFITDVYAAVGDRDITADDVIKQFKDRFKGEDLSMIFGLDSDYDVGRKLAWDFIDKTGIGAPPQVLLNGVILKKTHLNGDMFEEVVFSEILKQTPFIQKSVYKGELTDSHDVLDFLMSQPNVLPRLNKRILSTGNSYIDMTGRVLEGLNEADYEHLTSGDMGATFAAGLKYLTKKNEISFRPLTIWVVGDWSSKSGQKLLSSALAYVKASDDIRWAIVHNPEQLTTTSNKLIAAVQACMDILPNDQGRIVLGKIIKEAHATDIQSGSMKLSDFVPQDFKSIPEGIEEQVSSVLKIHSLISQQIMGLSAGQRAIVVNGRIIGPLNADEELNEDDFNLLEKYSMSVYGDKLVKELKGDESTANADSDLIMKATSVLMPKQMKKTRHDLKHTTDKHSVLKVSPLQPEEPFHDIIAITDPLTRGAQKLSSMLMVLRNVVNAKIQVYLNCIDKHSNMPLKTFYRFVLESEPQFGSNGESGFGPMARFGSLPPSPLLTLAMATPENWLVEAVRSPYDLDNIHLQDVERGVYAEFELENLLLEGHCFEQSTGNPPRGLQFTLGTSNSPIMVDTIVMANLGYFQLKANPGVWLLRMRQGRSADLYDVSSHENTDTPPGSPDVVVAIANFRSQVIKIRVSKKPGKQSEDLLYDDEVEESGIWDTIKSIPIIGGILIEWRDIWAEISSSFRSEKKDKEEEEDDKINIFSLASGHLYERLLRIMMLSVLKHTKTPVKFWFLKNYLSPTFKDFLPLMSKEHGFEYELVEYKWPRWLNQQTEKQRIIWGYKILFLDVLFPLDIKKIIFVDADQVVRSDMKELRDLDLGGAPYGYTPFCESRTDMDGYRFWKSGYWASHLAGRKYHISALYVVDLKRFRRIAAGDRLRGQYQGLSQDPNSLSNLDQDLPNNMIHQVSIKSLPQEWLWCETWCDDASKAQAKTIDLCNNPNTKEPKLVAAMRIIPEWKDYDAEVKRLQELYQVAKKKKADTLDEDSTTHTHTEL